jgi:aquaporin Z
MKFNDFIAYAIAQCVGALLGAGILYAIASGNPNFNTDVVSLGANGFNAGEVARSPGGYNMQAAFLFEVVATFLFLVVILGATQAGAPGNFAGLAIGLTLAVIHIVGIQVTGVSVNPARSLGPAVFEGAPALNQLWLFIIAPLIGAGLAGLLFRQKILTMDNA